MQKIINIKAREIIDSRGNPTIECDVLLDNKINGRASVPSGSSTGSHEAIELRDNNPLRFHGKGVLNAVSNINNQIAKNLIGINIFEQNKIDEILISLDGQKNKSNLGANSLLAVSLACARAASNSKNIFFYEYIGNNKSNILPLPLINIINGGVHADNKIDIQEFMISPVSAKSFKEAIQIGCEIFHNLKILLSKKGYNTNVGEEGGFAPDLNSSNEAIELILESILKSGYKEGSDVFLSLDVASNEIYNNNKYNLLGENKSFDSDQMCSYLSKLVENYPIFSIEDGIAEDDFEGWKKLTELLGNKVQLVGDDLFVTNIERLKNGVNMNIANSILIKLNQIGTLTETIDVINFALKNKYSCIISHRSGETEDTTIADLAVAFNTGQIKTGSLSRSERLSKYNQLIRIEEYLGKNAKYAGNKYLNSKL